VEGGLHAGSLLKVNGREVPDDAWDRAATKDGEYGGNAWESGGGRKSAGGKGQGAAMGGAGKSERYVWYGEHSNIDAPRDGYETGDDFLGGVGACSTDDFITWRNEGVMLHYTNITDMVYGSAGPFVVERPKVLYNNDTKKYERGRANRGSAAAAARRCGTKLLLGLCCCRRRRPPPTTHPLLSRSPLFRARSHRYVMWMTVDDVAKTLGLAGVAVSDYPNGPFDFVRTVRARSC
jgi:hypothetical protein